MTQKQGSIILLSGPVGAGKSTVATELKKLMTGPVAYIEGDKFWGFIIETVSINKLTNFKMIMRAMTVAAMPYARTGYRVIVDFSIPPWYLETLLKIIRVREIPVDFVVIRPDMEICAQRAAEREEGKVANYAMYKELYQSFDEVQRFIIYDNDSDAATIASNIIEGLDEGLFRVDG